MSDRLKQYLQEGLIERMSCLLSQPKEVLWVQVNPDLSKEISLPNSRVTVVSLEQAFVTLERYDAVVIEAAVLEATQLPSVFQRLSACMKKEACIFYGFYALGTAKEYLDDLENKGFPAMQPFLDMHDVADIVMAECITDVVSDNEHLSLPSLSQKEWLSELSAANIMLAIEYFASAHDIQLPPADKVGQKYFEHTTIELGFVHGIYKPHSKRVSENAHEISLDAIGGLSRKR